MTVAEQIGLNLRKVRRRANMSQDALSKRTGLHHTEISMLECGGRIPRLDTAIKIIGSTEAGPGDLVDGITWHEPPRWDERGWFTIVGLDEPVDVRQPRSGGEGV